MQRAHVLAERRKHPRAQLRLAARIRWQGPLGMRLEVAETVDVSREGVSLACRTDLLATMSRGWVVVPFDASAAATMEPETPARVARVERDTDGGYRVALQLEPRQRNTDSPSKIERRGFARLAVCLPIFVRPAETPWPEETMTRDFARGGLRFETPHVYAAGENIRAKIPWGEWADAGEISGRVVRVEPAECAPRAAKDGSAADTGTSCVAVQWLDAGLRAANKLHG